jgi:hypothetical protein
MCIAQQFIPTTISSSSLSLIKPLSISSSSNIFPAYHSLSSSLSSLTLSSNTTNNTNNNNDSITSKALKSIKTLGLSSIFH